MNFTATTSTQSTDVIDTQQVARPPMIHIIAPRKREFGCGVCDQNDIVERKLKEAGIQTRTSHLTQANSFEPGKVQNGDVVFVQLSIYGYSNRGVPLWLPQLLSRLKARGAQIVIFFHELWVQWPRISSSAFWLASLQYLICRRILKLSDIAIFNAEWGYNWAKASNKGTIKYLRTFSNVGEPDETSDWLARENNMVVFGNASARAEIYRSLVAYTDSKAENFKNMGLIDIGSESCEIDQLLSTQGALTERFNSIQRKGKLPAVEVGRVLNTNKFGLFSAPWDHAGKSSVLAGYSAHGICPVSIHSHTLKEFRSQFAPMPDRHYAVLKNMDLHAAATSQIYLDIAKTARSSYQSSQDIVDLLLNELATRPMQKDTSL